MMAEFFKHGVSHVLTGWDHLLFAAALILALRNFWDIFKIIGVFTIAHSITLALTALRGEPLLSPQIVEPIIAGSIIVVALTNLWRPSDGVDWRRLAMAFGFGLVHGLGLAGAMLESMADLPKEKIGWAIAAFCVGVELGHLCVVAPLSAALKVGREAQPSFHGLALRWGSVVLALGGVYYLVAALGWLG
jgi:hydrogenase/urease accessory protein HupE